MQGQWRPGAARLAAALLLLATAPAGAQPCPADCSGDGSVTTGEIVIAIEVGLGRRPAADCTAAGQATVDVLTLGVRARLEGCALAGTYTPTPSPTPTSTPAPTATASPGGSQVPPTTAAALLAWLQAGEYLGWQAESGVHASVGPHFGRVRTYLNDSVVDSLATGAERHSAGAALVKELYGAAGDAVLGWAVMVKTAEDSGVGDGWYWYERFGSSTFAAGNGSALCYSCHGNPPYPGIVAKDFVLTPFPLQ